MSKSEPWQRVTIRMPQSMIDDLDAAVEAGEYPNRSAAIRSCINEEDL